VLDGRIWRIDTGVSAGIASGTAEVLEIVHSGNSDGTDRVRIISEKDGVVDWSEREVFMYDF